MDEDGELELWTAARSKDLLEEVLGLPVHLSRAQLGGSEANLVAS
jgi:hypothetical protein